MRGLSAAFILAALSGCALGKTEAAPRQFQSPQAKLTLSEASPKAASTARPLQKRAEAKEAPRRWTATGSFTRGRFGGTMQKLRDGRVLLVGGLLEGVARGLPDVDLYDPATGEWAPGAPLHEGRYWVPSVLLADGRVLISGGYVSNGKASRTTEIFDPLTNSWAEAAPMAQDRWGHRLVLLPDGRVLAAGGQDIVHTLSSAEVYDPAADSWSSAGTMSAGRTFLAAAALSSGKVLITGGIDKSTAREITNATAEIYDPGANRWTSAGSMNGARHSHQEALLPDGRMVVSGGGNDDGVADTAEVYDPATGRWTPTGPMGVRRYAHTMVVLGGTPLIIGGLNRSTDLDSTEFYDAAANAWRPGPRLSGGRCYPLAALLDDGRVLVASGRRGLSGGTVLASAELLSASGSLAQPSAVARPSGSGWNAFARLPAPLSGPIVSSVDGKIIVISGNPTNGVPTAEVNAFDLKLRTWTPRSPAPQPLANSASAVLNGLIYVAGGCAHADCSFPTAAANAYDPKTDLWTPLPPLPETIYGSQGAALNGRFYVFGGVAGPIHQSGATARAYVFDPAARIWSRLRDMPRRRTHAAGAELGGRFILTGGCTSATPGRPCDEITPEAVVYDAGSDSWSPFGALPMPLWGHGAVSDGGRIIVAGGSPSAATMGGARTFILARDASRWSEGPPLLWPRFFPSLFSLPRGVGLFGTNGNVNGAYLNTHAEDLIESLGAPGPFIDPGAPPSHRPAPVEPMVPSRATFVMRTPAPAFDPESPENLPAAVAEQPRAHAIVIGIERYRETLPRADFAAGDAKLAAEYFRRVLGVPEDNLALLSDDRATKSDFEKYFERWLPNRVEAGDEVYVYFSGHGAPNPKTGESYLVPFDADPTYIEQTGYSLKRLYEVLAKLPAKRVVLVLDSCFSGAGGRSVIAQGARPLVSVIESGVPRPLIVISASGGDQISNSYQEKRHGLFTYFFLRGLKEKGADLRAVYDYLKPQVSRVARRQYNADQVPQWRKGK